MTAVAKRKIEAANVEIIPQQEQRSAASLLDVISAAAADANIDVVKLEKLMDLYERVDGKKAKTAYLAALSEMQPKLPVIDKKGTINKNEKDAAGNRTGRQEAMTKYAKWEDVVEGITPVLAAHGFSLSFRVSQPTLDRIIVAGVLGHKDGHTEETSISLPIDSSGAKNNVQGWGSSVSYGKRYTAFALLNISARGEDDDGKAAGEPGFISEEQQEKICAELDAVGADIAGFCNYVGVEGIAKIPASKYERALEIIAAKRRKAGR